ncbi:peptide deformylase, partial [Brevibacterium paucivorans]
MAPIVQAGDPVLRRPAAAYTGQLSDEQLFGLLEVMRATMHAAPGVGLAAPQIGIGVRIAVIEDRVRLPEDQAR